MAMHYDWEPEFAVFDRFDASKMEKPGEADMPLIGWC
jgi:hypothetical protein